MDLATDRENTKVDYLLRMQELGSGSITWFSKEMS
jgi:hypothetical protein